MDGRESSTPSSVDFYDTEEQDQADPPPPAKRKAEDEDLVSAEEKQKKRKLDSPSPLACSLKPCAGLPPAVWQHVFLSCSLHDLGRLLQVNRSFHSYLTDVSSVSPSDPASGSLRLLQSESLWASARNALPIKPPKPLPGFSELQMWQLVWSKRCQFCRKESTFVPGEKIWQKGPGANGVRTIWPFGIRSCGPCLLKQCQTDASLLFSSASALRHALPFAFVTNDYNYIPAYTLQAATTPATVDIVKYYHEKHVEDIRKELNEALGLGSAAAEEWSKGLEARGSERMRTAENWERWEVKYEWWSDHHEPNRAASIPPVALSPAPVSRKETSQSPVRQGASPVIYAPVPAGKSPLAPSFARDVSLLQRLNRTPPPSTNLTPAATPSQYLMSRPPTVPHQHTPQPAPSSSVQPGRSERNLHDVNEAKANRKADIERRCQHMQPPIPPNVLRHMDSFKAALQISQPMTDYAWSVLQPRLLAQLLGAQQAEADYVSRVAPNSKIPERRTLDFNSKEAKEAMDREWDEAQRPVRDKLAAIADTFINQDWDHGRAVTYENSPKFAVDLLMYVRRMFLGETRQADADEADRPKLILENMKWVYDNKVKPLTEQFRKEIFLCYGQGCEGNTKYYGFEGVIQHFGAKHTNAFSVGNIVVAWREAEWPEETPFHPDPISVKNTYHAPPSASGHAYGTYYGGYSRAATSTPHMQAHLPQASPGPYHYAGHYNGPFAPPQLHATATPGYEYGQSYGTQLEAYQFQSMAAPSYSHQPGNGYVASPAMSNPAMVTLPPGQNHVPGTHDTLPKVDESDHRTSLYDKQVSTVISLVQDIWKQTSGVEGLPNNLRIYVLLHRVISKFHVEFNYEPNLNHFIDAFSNHKIPRALKGASGIYCKACQDQHPGNQSGQEERRAFTPLALFSHFKSQHSGAQTSSYANSHARLSRDWKEDMIELPSDRSISGLIHAPGMDDDKLLMVATVFPTLFPTPLPKIGVVDGKRTVSPVQSVLNDNPHEVSKGETSGAVVHKSGPTLASPYTGSPRPTKPVKDEYDPQRPALPGSTDQSAPHANKRHSYRGSPPPAERRGRYYTEPQYYLPREHAGREHHQPGDSLEFASSPRRMREPRPYYEEYHERRPIYRDEESFYRSADDEMAAQPREGAYFQEHRPSSRHVRYMEEPNQPLGSRYTKEAVQQERKPPMEKSEADRFLEEFIPSRPPTNEQTELGNLPQAGSDFDNGSRYTPSPANQAPSIGTTDPRRMNGLHQPAASSNGSRYEAHGLDRLQNYTPDSGRGLRRPGPQRRRDRHHDHVPSRYYRYMSVARDEPYSRGASISRAQSKRYEEQRRRIDQQETPQPNVDQDPTYSRDHSVERGPTEDAPPGRVAPREYVSVQDRYQPRSPPRYRYADYPEDPRAHAPVYYNEHGHRIHEYEIIRVPRDPYPPRGAYVPHTSPRYLGHESEVRYVSYEPPPSRYAGGHPEYVYFEERERPPSMRTPAGYDDETYEPPPPEIKVEPVAPVPDVP
ncbi:hypothetical protein CC80DRAFT_484454 [Byssothecium circinans]|uniref:DUF7892 domain-containing protein n=1 Tax=Byssothecium circinans TaxID=147558 RepID=A0A6A5T930_9PLEO|nr:hypothetical protein CC80DRAFT_484454 [Byssothecium circinans]